MGRATPEKPDNIVPLGTGTGKFWKVLIYGEPGTFKSTLMGTAPNCLFIEADKGDATPARRGSTAEKWEVRDWDDIYECLSWLKLGGAQHYEWIVLDSISLFQNLGLKQIMEDLVAEKPNRKVWQVDKGEYGQNMNRLMNWLREFVELPNVNLAVVAHIGQDTDHEGEYRYMPQIQGKDMPGKVCALFDIVGWMSTRVVDGEEKARLCTKKEGKYYAKDRSGAIGALVDPTIPKIMRRIEKAQEG